jgi:hypothetical protein
MKECGSSKSAHTSRDGATGNGTKKATISQNVCEQIGYGIQGARPKHLSEMQKMAQEATVS